MQLTEPLGLWGAARREASSGLQGLWQVTLVAEVTLVQEADEVGLRKEGAITAPPHRTRRIGERGRRSVRGKARDGVMRHSRRIGGKGDSTDGSGLGGEVGSCLEGHRIATTAYEAVGQMGRYKVFELAGRTVALRPGARKQTDSGTNTYESDHFPAHHRPRRHKEGDDKSMRRVAGILRRPCHRYFRDPSRFSGN